MYKHLKERGDIIMKKLLLVLCMIVGLACVIPGPQAEAKSKVSYTYTTKTKKYKASDGTVVFKVSYKGVKFKGSSAAVKKMNKTIEKDRTQFFKNAKSYVSTAQDSYDSWKKYSSSSTKFYVSSMSVKSSVTFNKKGIVSIKQRYNDYFSGAVHGFYYTYGQTFKISTGKKLTLNQVIKGSNTSDKKKLVAAFKKMDRKNPDLYWDYALDTVKNTKLKKAKFYLSSKNAVVCYEPYSLSFFAAGETYIKIPHAYK